LVPATGGCFDHTVAPLLASFAVIVPSNALMNSKSLTPDAVVTPGMVVSLLVSKGRDA